MHQSPAAAVVVTAPAGAHPDARDVEMVERKGRGNRVGGLITPCRPMTLEAAAGKNAAMHVGKSYSIVSRTGWRERSWRSALTSPRPPVSW